MSFEFAMHESILKGVHEYNFRGGIFKSQIPKSTSVVQAYNILISSADTTQAEKRVFKDARKVFITLSKLGREPTLLDVLPSIGGIEKMREIFEKDARSQGIYVPGTTMQTLNNDGTVKETIVVNSDGSSTTSAGGIHGVPTGAPAHFVKQQEAQTKFFSEALKKDGGASSPHKDPAMDGKKSGGRSSILILLYTWLTWTGVAAPKKDDVKEVAGKRPSDPGMDTQVSCCIRT